LNRYPVQPDLAAKPQTEIRKSAMRALFLASDAKQAAMGALFPKTKPSFQPIPGRFVVSTTGGFNPRVQKVWSRPAPTTSLGKSHREALV